MKKYLILSLFFLSVPCWSIPAFPGAEGWGSETPGGRGGRIVMVTTLSGGGAGSLRTAFQMSGKRIIIFRVSGVIDVKEFSQWRLTSANSEFTLAGQTSPGGVTIVSNDANLSQAIIMCYNPCGLHDFIMRFVRFRGKSYNMDAFTLASAYNFVIDHCDFSGGQDETFDLCHCYDFTVSWTTVANSSVCSGCQTYGALIGYEEMTHVTHHHMLYAHHKNRGGPHFHFGSAPVPVDFGQIDYRNNVSYNIGQSGFYVSYSNTKEFHVNCVGNYMKWGPDSRDNVEGLISLSGAHVYNKDNCAHHQNGSVTTGHEYGSVKVTTPWDMPAVTTTSGQQAYEDVCNLVGAFPRDPMNTRTIQEVRSATGTYGKTDDAMIQSGPEPPADADMDGMPDFWEDGMGLNKNDENDHSGDIDGDGYTNIEEYINDLANARLCLDYYNHIYPIPDTWDDYNPSCCKSLAMEEGVGSVFKSNVSLSISPSPYYGGILTLQLKGIAPVGKIQVVDINGREIAHFDAKAVMHWDGKSLSSGIYLVRYITDDKTRIQKRIVVVQ
jgi:pectate lyase